MNAPTPTHVLRFGVFELDTNSGELRRHGLKIRLPDQSFQILKKLLSRPGEVVTREELRRVLWTTETFVDFEVGLNSAVRKLREALDDSAEIRGSSKPCLGAAIDSSPRSRFPQWSLHQRQCTLRRQRPHRSRPAQSPWRLRQLKRWSHR